MIMVTLKFALLALMVLNADLRMNFTKREISQKIQEQISYFLYEADVGKDADARDYEVSYDKIKALGYGAKMDIHRGIKELIDVLKHIHITNEWRNI